MSRSYTKAQRLNDIQHILVKHHHEGTTKEAIAEHFGVDRSTIQRDISELQDNGVPVYEVRHGYFALDPAYLRYNLDFSSAESLILYLAARRMARQASNAIAPILNALDKLADGLRKPMMEALREALGETGKRPADLQKETHFEALTKGWLNNHYVKIVYRGLHSLNAHSYHLAPYLFEPSPWGEGTYIVGYVRERDALMTLKLERVEKATTTNDPFTIPDSFDQNTLLNHAWGVWMGEGDPVRVILHFSPQVIRRVRENRWHPSETIRDLPSGGLQWSAEVSEPKEMLPWIRGWGADVEIIEPPSLREELMIDLRRLNYIYEIESDVDEYGLPR
ncbi:MAG TPA: WYL domain-containing protein [Aggregatilineales bacterium]|nr:transcriptional regulator [Anaerolineales bacterium]HRE48637.1 WYL domain-containing protein [Aggregatilineales bacterium]